MTKILLAVILCSIAAISADAGNEVTAAQVNGTWKMRNNEFKIWTLGQQQLKIEFFGTFEHDSIHGRTANTGEGSGNARIEGDTATFKPDDAEDECNITLKFTGGKLIVTQNGICGFGFNVRADGTYKRVSNAKPRFDSE